MILDMLTYKRPHGSQSERAFIDAFIEPLAQHPNVKSFREDSAGNYIIETRKQSNGLLFVAHTDTVHRDEGMQRVIEVDSIAMLDADLLFDDIAFDKTVKYRPGCLGADDGAGVYLLIQMIKADVPATFVFTRGEEVGGIGSRYLAEKESDWLTQYKWAIAFDRRGTTSIITEQAACGLCASDDFALALADVLDLGHYPDPTGSFTDTANFTPYIPECTNVSVGYKSEHSANESLDLTYLYKLEAKLTSLDWDEVLKTLPVVRDVNDTGYTPKWGNPLSTWRNTDYISGAYADYSTGLDNLEWLLTATNREVVDYVRKSEPEDVADLLLELADQLAYRSEMYN